MLEIIFSKMCRCCMKNGEFDMFSTLFDSQTVAKILEQLITEQISSEDQLPKTICHQCFNKIISQFLFIKNFQRVQEQLLEILKRKKVVDEKQENTHLTGVVDASIKNEYDGSDDDQPLSLLFNEKKKCIHERSVKSSVDGLGEIHTTESAMVNNIKHINLLHHELREIIPQKEKNDDIFFLPTYIIEKGIQNIPCKEVVDSNLEKNDANHSLPNNVIKKEIQDVSCKEYVNLNSPTTNYCQHDGNGQIKEKHSQSSRKKTRKLKHTCNDCSVSFEFIKQLRIHCGETGHIFPRKFTCEVCSKKFLSNTCLNDHMRIHNNERPFACNECGMSFTLRPNLKRHTKKHTGEKSYFCEVCGKGFIQKQTLTVHMRLHNGETPYVCDLCGKGFRAKPFLLQHLDKHNSTEIQTLKNQKNYLKYGKTKVECKVCQKIITKSGLYNHMKAQHGDGLKNFLCNLCGKTYASKTSLDVHMNLHTKINSYDCKICSKSFTHKNYLKSHIMLHSGERPHCCDLCGKTFVQKTHLDRHMKTHTGARPYVCTYCNKAFALNENLKVHIRIHTNETPHYCSVCGKGFFNSSSKKKHETSVHQIHQK